MQQLVHDLLDPHTASYPVNISLKPGTVLAIYTDQGPSGICGQSMSVTCPHTYIYVFDTFDEFRQHASTLGRKGKKAEVRWCEIGNSGIGMFHLYQYQSNEKAS